MARKVILLTGHPNLRPLWGPLGEHYDLAFTAAAAAQQAAGMGLTVVDLQTVVSAETIERADSETAHLTAAVVNNLPRIRAVFAGAYPESVSPQALSTGVGSWLPGFMLGQIRGLAGNLAAIEALFKARAAVPGGAVAAVLVHEDVSPEHRALVLLARAHGVQTIHLPHAPCHLKPGIVDIHRETLTDWILASGEGMRRFYLESGYPSDRLFVTGAPQWDNLYTEAIPSRETARQVVGIGTLGLAEGAPVLCYASSWAQSTSLRGGFSEELRRGFAAVVELCRSTGAGLIVKTHPSEGKNEAYYAKEMQAAQVAGLVTRDHLPYVLRAADAIVAQGPSNLCVQAAILGTPSAYLQTDGFDFVVDLPYRAPAGSLAALSRAIESALSTRGHEQWDPFATYYNAAHPERGGAAQRTADLIAGIAG